MECQDEAMDNVGRVQDIKDGAPGRQPVCLWTVIGVVFAEAEREVGRGGEYRSFYGSEHHGNAVVDAIVYHCL